MNNDGEPFVCSDCTRPFGAHSPTCPRLHASPMRYQRALTGSVGPGDRSAVCVLCGVRADGLFEDEVQRWLDEHNAAKHLPVALNQVEAAWGALAAAKRAIGAAQEVFSSSIPLNGAWRAADDALRHLSVWKWESEREQS